MAYTNGMVKKTPTKHPRNPTIANSIAIIIKPIITKGCLETIRTLDFMAVIAFISLKIISGIVNKVKPDMTIEITKPSKGFPEYSKA